MAPSWVSSAFIRLSGPIIFGLKSSILAPTADRTLTSGAPFSAATVRRLKSSEERTGSRVRKCDRVVPQLDRKQAGAAGVSGRGVADETILHEDDFGGRFEHEGPRQQRSLIAGFFFERAQIRRCKGEYGKLRRAGLGRLQRGALGFELLRREGQACVRQSLVREQRLDENILRIGGGKGQARFSCVKTRFGCVKAG